MPEQFDIAGILKKYRIGKHFELDVREDGFNYKVNENALLAEVTAKSKDNQELIKKRLKRSRRHIESIIGQFAKLSQRIEKGRLHGQDKIGEVSARLSTSTRLASISIWTFVTMLLTLK